MARGPLEIAPADAGDALARLRRRLADDGLHIVLPIGRSALDEVCRDTGGAALDELIPGGTGGVVIGDGGPEFFSRFFRRRDDAAGARDPLDEYTRRVVETAVAEALGPWPEATSGIRSKVLFPFSRTPPVLPFQRLGVTAGLPAPGPLGIQIHPRYGPWWAYRALVLWTVPQHGDGDGDGDGDGARETETASACSACPAPCQAACPGAAVRTSGFLVERCAAHRLQDARCHGSCAARLRCPVGEEHRYPAEQLAFHMRASLVEVRARRGQDVTSGGAAASSSTPKRP